MEPWAAAEKRLASVAVLPAPVRVPSERPLTPSVASITSVAIDKGDNEMIPGVLQQISWHFPWYNPELFIIW